jgi:hypothetical protein
MTLRDWFPVITLVLGSALTIIGGLISEHYRTKASLAQAKLEREIQDNLAWTTFQRDNVLQLQDAGQDLIQFTLQCFNEKWPDKPPPPPADPGKRHPQPVSEKVELDRIMARIRVNKLASRLQDQQGRTDINGLLELSHEVMDCDNFEIARTKLVEMRYKLRDANEEILGPILWNTFPSREGRNTFSGSDNNPGRWTPANKVSS